MSRSLQFTQNEFNHIKQSHGPDNHHSLNNFQAIIFSFILPQVLASILVSELTDDSKTIERNTKTIQGARNHVNIQENNKDNN